MVRLSDNYNGDLHRLLDIPVYLRDPPASPQLFDPSRRQQGRLWTFLVIFLQQNLLNTGVSHNICDVRATTTCLLRAGSGQRKELTDLHTFLIFLATRCYCADPVIRRECLRDLRFCEILKSAAVTIETAPWLRLRT
jgi:hypothetical protein